RTHRAQSAADLPISAVRHLTPVPARCEISVDPNITRRRVPNEEIRRRASKMRTLRLLHPAQPLGVDLPAGSGAIVLLHRRGVRGGGGALLGQSKDEYVTARAKAERSAARAGNVARIEPEHIAAAAPRDDHVDAAVDKTVLDEIIEIPRRRAERVRGLAPG